MVSDISTLVDLEVWAHPHSLLIAASATAFLVYKLVRFETRLSAENWNQSVFIGGLNTH